MPLLRHSPTVKVSPLRPYTTLACQYNGFQVSWCRGLCAPQQGVGACGRLAPHAMTGRTQEAIASYLARLPREHT